MRINVNNAALPGVQTEPAITLEGEIHRRDVFASGSYIGQVVYLRRTLRAGGSLYGWRPARSHANVALTSQVDAIRRLPRWLVADVD